MTSTIKNLRRIVLAGCAIALVISPVATFGQQNVCCTLPSFHQTIRDQEIVRANEKALQAWTNEHTANMPPADFVCENLNRQIVKLNVQPAHKLLQVQDQNGNIIESYTAGFALSMNLAHDAFGQPAGMTYSFISAMSQQNDSIGPVAGLAWIPEEGGWVFFWHHDDTSWKCLQQRCWKYDWVLEFDIRGLFDNINHELLLRAVRKHVKCKRA